MEKFCCCWTLTKGGRFIGFVCLALSIISFAILTTYLLTDLDGVVNEISTSNVVDASTVEKTQSTTKTVAAIFLVISTLLLVSSFMLIRATSNGSKNLIKPFMFTLFATVVVLLCAIFQTYGNGYTFLLALPAAIFGYFLISTYSLYKEYSEFDNEVDFQDAGMKGYNDQPMHNNGPPGYSMPEQQYVPQQPDYPPQPAYPMMPQEQIQPYPEPHQPYPPANDQPPVQMPMPMPMPMPYQPAPAYTPNPAYAPAGAPYPPAQNPQQPQYPPY